MLKQYVLLTSFLFLVSCSALDSEADATDSIEDSISLMWVTAESGYWQYYNSYRSGATWKEFKRERETTYIIDSLTTEINVPIGNSPVHKIHFQLSQNCAFPWNCTIQLSPKTFSDLSQGSAGLISLAFEIDSTQADFSIIANPKNGKYVGKPLTLHFRQ